MADILAYFDIESMDDLFLQLGEGGFGCGN
jgi:hypothetical protein